MPEVTNIPPTPEEKRTVNPARILGRVFNPYSALDLPSDASEEAITARYQELLATYHPSKVAHLPEAVRKLAHDRTIQVQKAYQMLQREEEDI